MLAACIHRWPLARRITLTVPSDACLAGLVWEALEKRELEPPHAHYTRECAARARRGFMQPEPVRKLGFAM